MGDKDTQRIEFKLPKSGYDKLTTIADTLGFSGRSDLIRAALVEYCTAHGQPLTEDDLRLGTWGGWRGGSPPEKEGSDG